jgi:DNA-directed RNA polymerase
VYPLPSYLNPQERDTSRALLEFANGQKIDEAGAHWLCVHIANIFDLKLENGQDVAKLTLEDRAAWTRSQHDKLIESAKNPLAENALWKLATDPFQALAACFEYADWIELGDAHVSHLPIWTDATCSGLQHFSAVLRDRTGALAVNLIDNKTGLPADIYSNVARKLASNIERIADGRRKRDLQNKPLTDEDREIANLWVGWIDRKVVKQPTMSKPYSVTSDGIARQIAKKGLSTDCVSKMNGEDWSLRWKMARWITPWVVKAIDTQVGKASEAMNWLIGLSSIVGKAGVHMSWMNSLDFPVMCDYLRQEKTRPRCYFASKGIRPVINVTTDKVDVPAHRRSVSANVVHSLDATLIHCVARQMAHEGMPELMCIHDAVAVHASNVEPLQRVIRSEMINIYGGEQDILQEIYDQAAYDLRDNKSAMRKLARHLATKPTMGTLEVEDMTTSTYLFS